MVHAVLAAASPGVTVIDLTHQIPAFDVRAGSHTLVRIVPHLGPGVVLAVVDPGVGSSRRGLCIEVTLLGGEPGFFVGPDNGLLIAAAESAGEAPISRAFELRRDRERDRGTFDGRDLFAPVAAALSRGVPPADLGDPVDPHSLLRITGGVVEQGRLGDGRSCMRAEVMWVDHFGNLQLAATFADAQAAGVPSAGAVDITVLDPLSPAVVEAGKPLRRVGAFADLAHGELGLLIDSNGHVAVVAGEASAASQLNVSAGALVVLAW